jgi:hypothetical protein
MSIWDDNFLTITVVVDDPIRPSTVLDQFGNPMVMLQKKQKLGFDLRPVNDNKKDKLQGCTEGSQSEDCAASAPQREPINLYQRLREKLAGRGSGLQWHR